MNVITITRQCGAGYFAADWSDPLEYHLTINSGRLGAAAVDLAALAAERHWSHAESPVAAGAPP